MYFSPKTVLFSHWLSLTVYYSRNRVYLHITCICMQLYIYIENMTGYVNMMIMVWYDNYRAHSCVLSLLVFSMCFFFSVLIMLYLGHCWNFRMKISLLVLLGKKQTCIVFPLFNQDGIAWSINCTLHNLYEKTFCTSQIV